jgi:hypothetical protein
MNQTIRFRKNVIAKIFPSKFTKMRMEDFVSKAVDNKEILNEREFKALSEFSVNLENTHKECFEFIAKKHKDKIEFVGFDE